MSNMNRSAAVLPPSTKPCCPNHGEPLEGIPFPIPRRGTAMCPVSGYSFDYQMDVDQATIAKDKFGNATKKIGWKVEEAEDQD